MKFAKLQATGNDFILVDARASEFEWAKLAKDMCQRQFGVGADGLIAILPSKRAILRMRLFNPDGSEAEISGNGLRCFAKYVVDRGIVSGHELTVETLAGIRTIETHESQDKVTRAEVNMGKPRFKPEDIPVRIPGGNAASGNDSRPILEYDLSVSGKRLSLCFVSMGNPHAVAFVQEPVAIFPLSTIGPQVENHPMFPERTNFEVARILGQDKIEARVWERGVGETLSCGSGACAIAVASVVRGMTGGIVDIKLDGGDLTIGWDRVGEVYLAGPVEEVFTGEWLK
ncbi:MAG: diaminopimelate epimerase [Chloroflexi bacterium]|nr:diaminopimelate epimerase [Chloroflexota bacterium]MBM4452665.1 diaminopimelate epimerase [Chloroflexota bacterium]MBM4454152.1 diaminopimelate epimerase [Chloroflexota bacterium]